MDSRRNFTLTQAFKRLLSDRAGATAVEYGVLITFIAAALVGAFINTEGAISAVFTRLAAEF